VDAEDASGATIASTPAVPAAPMPSSVDQSNAGDGSGFALADEFGGSFAGQSFTVGRTGTLAGFQFSALAADGGAVGLDTVTVRVLDEAGNVLLFKTVLLQLEGGCCGVAGPPPVDQASFALQTVDVSELHFPVTAGEVLRFEVHSFNAMQVGDSVDLYGGGSESVNGVAMPGRDLAFQVLVQ
jgi:hypothetical protein